MITQHPSAMQRGLLELVEKAFFVLSLLLIGRGLAFLFKDIQSIGEYSIADSTDGNRSFQLAIGIVYLTSAVYLGWRWRDTLMLVRRNWPYFLFMGLLLASIVWSEAPGLSMRRGIALFGNTLFVMHLTLAMPRDEMLELMGVALLGLVGINILVIIAFPQVGIDYVRGGPLRGILGHKNDFGATMVLCAVVFWTLRSRAGLKGMVFLAATAVALLLAFLSQSRSAWAVALVSMAVVPAVLFVLRGRRVALSLRWSYIIVGGVAGAGILMVTYETLLNAVGKDVTLTDRTVIWQIIFNYILDRLWLGHGYESFYQSEIGMLFATRWAEIGHAHNGYLDIWLDLGLIGLGLFVFLALTLILRVIREVVRYEGPNVEFFAQFLALVLVLNSVAQALPEHSSLMWTLFSAACFYTVLPYPIRFRRREARSGLDPIDLPSTDNRHEGGGEEAPARPPSGLVARRLT